MANSKELVIERIMESVIQLEVTKGHLQWRLSDISRISGVTRTLLYYYFGKNKKDLFKQAVHYYADVFLDFRIERAEKIKRGEITELISVARKRFKKNPYFFQFYARHRFEETEASPIFQQAEKRYFENLRETLPARRRPMARVLWALVFGLAVQPNISDEDLRNAEKFIRKIWPSPKN